MKHKRFFKLKVTFILILVALLVGLGAYIQREAEFKKESTMHKRKAENFREGKFHNQSEWVQPNILGNLSIMWDFFFKGENRTPENEIPRTNVDYRQFSDTSKDQLSATWLGHSSLMINLDGYKILTDPVFEKKVSFFGPTRFNGDSPVNTDSLPQVDLVIISHNHYDHLNEYSIKKLLYKTKLFIVPLGVARLLISWGVDAQKIKELDWWDECVVDENLTIAATPAQHFSGRGLFDRDRTLWASWVIKSKYHKVFFSGDSGYFDGFKKIGEKYGPFDMTFIECGAYNELWHHIHMFPEETVQAHLDVKGTVLHPIHWGTFNLSLHPWDEPMKRVVLESQKKNVQLTTPVVGGITIFGKTEDSLNQWWLQK